jgi:hypothetical protein
MDIYAILTLYLIKKKYNNSKLIHNKLSKNIANKCQGNLLIWLKLNIQVNLNIYKFYMDSMSNKDEDL